MAVIVQAANFVAPRSGGIRTALDAIGRGYQAAGHEPVLLVPGPRDADVATPAGRRVSLRGVPLPASGGYRVLVERSRVLRRLEQLGPDRLEVSDKLTLGCLGPWARARGVPAVLVSHERLDQLLALRLPGSVSAPTWPGPGTGGWRPPSTPWSAAPAGRPRSSRAWGPSPWPRSPSAST